SVIKGMLAAIGIILILNQVPHAFGYDRNAETDESLIQSGESNVLTTIIDAVTNPHVGALLIAGVTLAILLLWDMPRFREKRFAKVLPGPLVAVMAGVAVSEILRIASPAIAVSGDHLVTLP